MGSSSARRVALGRRPRARVTVSPVCYCCTYTVRTRQLEGKGFKKCLLPSARTHFHAVYTRAALQLTRTAGLKFNTWIVIHMLFTLVNVAT